ncbi:MAG: TlpA family protein disulfide reductase [Chitinophagaceae bacterium]|nr:TlpA family protein disulfide reductase [Chitinophagaceae bacterium]
MKKITLMSVLVMLCLLMKAQQPPDIKPLTIGDTVPDITITNVYNYPSSKIRLSDLKGKLVILDFWATWCSSCIAGFPHADSLQEEYKNEIQIFLVNSKPTGDNADKINLFFKKRETRTGLKNSLPIITSDTILYKYFPHRFIPHYVWIDQEGHLLATTSPLELNRSNIAAAIERKDFSGHIKRDETNFNRKKPPFWNGNGQATDNLVYRSLLTGYTEGWHGAGRRINEAGLNIGVYVFNVTALDLFKSAFQNESDPYFINNRIVLEVMHPEIFSNSFYNDTSKYSHSYCYDLTIPPSTEREMYQNMREDLERIFKVTAVIEKRQLPCIVLNASPEIGKAIARENIPKLVDIEKETLHKFIHNYPVASAVQLLNSFSSLPIIDESDLQANISLELPYNLSDTKAIIESLTNAGFKIKEETRLIDVTVLKDLHSLPG